MITLQLRGEKFYLDSDSGCWYLEYALRDHPIFDEMEESLGITNVLGYLDTLTKEGSSFRRRFEELVIP